MAEDGHTHVILRILLADTVCIVHRAAILRALGNDHDTAVLALTESTADELLELIDVCLVFRDDGRFRTGSDCTVLCQETGVTTHYLNEENTVVGSGGVTDFVHTFHDGVQCCIVTDGRIGAVKVIVNGARQSDYRQVIFFCQVLRSCQ